MSSVVDRIKELIARITAFWQHISTTWTPLVRILGMQERYTQRRGNVYAAAITFSGILSLVPILMVAFAITAFILASQPQLIDQITHAVIDNFPGQMGASLNKVIDSAIESRTTVGVVGLASAALTGIGWLSLVRTGLTEIWGGRIERNAILSKVIDLLLFVGLGLLFAVTFGLTVLTSGPIPKWVLEHIGLGDSSWAPFLLRSSSLLLSVAGMWVFFAVVLAKLPMQHVPIRAVFWTALITAVIFQVLKSVGGIYLRSVLDSPAGAAFGPILGIMVFTYLTSRIMLYAVAWCASNPANAKYTVDDELEPAAETEVFLAPVYESSSSAKARSILTAAGVGAAAAGVFGWLWRRGE
ncbi:MAG: YhjD/YihY/BrkB family envelope integrity protein [Gordonia sp. (in: high G+C Gram-positive bacteria)]